VSPQASLRGPAAALKIQIAGVVQGVGFRPFVYRLALAHDLRGWVLNGEDGVVIHAEGATQDLEAFVRGLQAQAPPAAQIVSLDTAWIDGEGFASFEIRASASTAPPTVRISPDLPVCEQCRRELFDSTDRRFAYPYINCTNCGPRYSIVLELPYDRARTTMRDWPLCEPCRREYLDPNDRRFHAQPVACEVCGPTYRLRGPGLVARADEAIAQAAGLLGAGAILAVKGIGGYHLACDAQNERAVAALRERKYRKERPFALMPRDLALARKLIELDAEAERLLASTARPIVLGLARRCLEGVAPDNREYGVVLPYAPLHHLLFAAGAPSVLVMTSANRSSEPIAYLDDDAFASLDGIADAFLAGERPIARRIDDSIARVGPQGPVILRRGRGLAPQAVAEIPSHKPILALGADLKNALTLVVDGVAFGSQHIGDLDQYAVRAAVVAPARDLCAMYEVETNELIVAFDAHPAYYSSEFAKSFAGERFAVQHHRAHIASVLAERGAWDEPVTGFAFDGTGYGDDGTIWGGEVFSGSLRSGLRRVAHLRTAALPGGDAAARFPVQAAAGFLAEAGDGVAFDRPPFEFPERFARARALVASGVRTFATTSMGRLFDTVAALLGFVREQTFEGQAAMWLEHVAREGVAASPYDFPSVGEELDYRPLLRAVIADRLAGRPVAQIARGFHGAVAQAIVASAAGFAARPLVVSGGVFQNSLLVELLHQACGDRLWMNRSVPPNDGGISLGQAALASVAAAGASPSVTARAAQGVAR